LDFKRKIIFGFSKINVNLTSRQSNLSVNFAVYTASAYFCKKHRTLIKKTTSELNRISPSEFKRSANDRITVVLDNIRSKQNIGSIFRICDAFGIGKIFLCGISACPPDREIERNALGATLSVRWKYFSSTSSCIHQLKECGHQIISIEQTHNSLLLNEFVFPQDKIALVFGNEVEGINEEVLKISHFCIEIPQRGTKHSLNVAVSAGIVLWEVIHKGLK